MQEECGEASVEGVRKNVEEIGRVRKDAEECGRGGRVGDGAQSEVWCCVVALRAWCCVV